MLHILVLGILLLLHSAPLEARGVTSIHRQAYDCMQQYGGGCDRVCLSCHEGAPRNGPITGQRWNPFLHRVDDHEGGFPGFFPKEGPEDFWDDLTKEHRSCRGCHDDHIGSEQHPIGMVVDEEEWPLADRDDEAGMRYFDGLLLCATCHDPHGREKALLRMANDGSKLCLHCHRK